MADTKSVRSIKSIQESEASSGERYARETAEKSVLLLAELLKLFKRNLPPDVAVKLEDNPDVSIKVGNEQVFKGPINKPEIDNLDKKDVDYLAFATGKSQGVKHIDLTRDVEILIAGKSVFEVKSGEVVLNLLTPQQTQKLVVELNSLEDLAKTPESRQAEYLDLAKQGAAVEGVDLKPNFALLKSEVTADVNRGKQLEDWVRQSALERKITPTDLREVLSAGVGVAVMREGNEPQENIDAYLDGSVEYHASVLAQQQAKATPEPSPVQPAVEQGQQEKAAAPAEPLQGTVLQQEPVVVSEPPVFPESAVQQNPGVAASERTATQDQSRSPVLQQLEQDLAAPTNHQEQYLDLAGVGLSKTFDELEPVLRTGVRVAALQERGTPPTEIDKYITDALTKYDQGLVKKQEKAVASPAPVAPAFSTTPAQKEPPRVIELGEMTINISSPQPEMDRQSQVLEAARNIVNQMGDHEGSGEREFCGAHFTINQYGDELKVLDSDGHNVAAVGGVGDRHDYAISPDLEDALLSASTELDVLMKDRELELEQEQESELELS